MNEEVYVGERNDGLLNNLRYADNLLRKIEQLKREISQIESGLKNTNPDYKKIWTGIKPVDPKVVLFLIISTAIGLMYPADQICAWLILEMGLPNITVANVLNDLVVTLLTIILITCIQCFANIRIRSHNRASAQHSEENKAYNFKMENLLAEKRKQRDAFMMQFGNDCSSWYPQTYNYSDASGFMLKKVESYQACSMQEAVAQYEMELQRRKDEQMKREELDEHKRHNRKTEAQADWGLLNDSIRTMNDGRKTSALERISWWR